MADQNNSFDWQRSRRLGHVVDDTGGQLWVNTLFRGRQVAEFLAVKRYLGIQSNAEIVRHLIHKQARMLQRRAKRTAVRRSRAEPDDRELQEQAGPDAGQAADPSELRDLCLACSLPDCDETDPRCGYQRVTGQRRDKNERMNAYSRRTRALDSET
jgi:hypothetical protein